MAPTIEVTRCDDNTITVVVPFNEGFVEKAKKLSGRWAGKPTGWVFPARLERQVRELCMLVYFDDGIPGPMVDIEVNPRLSPLIQDGDSRDQVIAGRIILRNRAGSLGLGEGVEVVAGEFWYGEKGLDWQPGSLLEIRGLPARVLEVIDVTGITVAAEHDNLAAMRRTRDWLQQRLQQLDKDIAEAEETHGVVPKPRAGRWGIRTLRAPNAKGVKRVLHFETCAQLAANRRYNDQQAQELLQTPDVSGCSYCKSAETLAIIQEQGSR